MIEITNLFHIPIPRYTNLYMRNWGLNYIGRVSLEMLQNQS